MFFNTSLPENYRVYHPKICELCSKYFLRLTDGKSMIDLDREQRLCAICTKFPDKATPIRTRKSDPGITPFHTTTNWSTFGVRG